MKFDPSHQGQISPARLALLACPKCKGKLTYNIEPTSLDCTACRLRYPMSAGIPVLLQESAKPL